MTSVSSSSPYSAWCGVARCPRDRGRGAGSRAGSRRRCRGTGSRARARCATAAITFSRSAYGLPGTTQMPSKALEVVGLGARRSSTGRARGRRGGAARRSGAGCARGRGRTASGLRRGRAWRSCRACSRARRVHVQRSFCGHSIRTLMDPRFLRTFVTVARLGSFSAAARELGYTQSGVSQHIAVLEADLGAVLLTRRPVAADRGGRAPARARRADPAAARRRPRRRGARGRRAADAPADRHDAAGGGVRAPRWSRPRWR